VDLKHILDKTGDIAAAEGPQRKLAEHFLSIVAAATTPFDMITPLPVVKCRRRPGRKPCPGEIYIEMHPDTAAIVWSCTICDDNGYISNWRGCLWDLGSMSGAH
jgi:hypothetical protein